MAPIAEFSHRVHRGAMRGIYGIIGMLAVVLSVAATLPPARASDGRIVVEPAAHPWRAIGRLNVAGYRLRRHCTAVLISADTVLTAHHCLSALATTGKANPERVHFVAGYDRGQFLAHRRAVSFQPFGTDAALVRLDAPLDIPPIPIRDSGPPRQGSVLAQAGYSGDRGHVLTVDPTCRFLGLADDGFWRHDCEAISGDSGSPIFIDGADGLRVAAIHIGRTQGSGLAEPITVAQVAAAQRPLLR